MWRTFNVVMRIISSLIGITMTLMGVVWILQGLNLAFRVGFMVGNYHWTVYGAGELSRPICVDCHPSGGKYTPGYVVHSTLCEY